MNRLLSRPVFWASMLIAQVCAFYLFKDLADISQWVLQGDRDVTMAVWYNRYLLASVALLCMSISLFIWWKKREVLHGGLLSALLLVFLFGWAMGMINPHTMMRPRMHDGVFVTVEQAKQYVNASESVIVYQLEGEKARAHADRQVLRPHVAGNKQQNAVMTYCGLTNLGMAFIPEIDGQKLDLAPFTQLENNLVMYDKISGEPVQQIWGQTESDVNQGLARGMTEVATFRMPFDKFAQAYPDGEVYVNDYLVEGMRPSFWENPFLAIYDPIMELIFKLAISFQHYYDSPVFPTISHFDDRLANKTLVWGFNIGDDYVAYSESFVRDNGNLVNTTVGGKPVVVAFDEQHESLGVFYNTTEQPIEQLDFWGNSEHGQLERVETVKAGAFWVVWANFFPQTDVNRV